jgi:hypothetical protein
MPVKNIVGLALIWLVLNAVIFVNRWDGGRTPARQTLRLLLLGNLVVLAVLAVISAFAWLRRG